MEDLFGNDGVRFVLKLQHQTLNTKPDKCEGTHISVGLLDFIANESGRFLPQPLTHTLTGIYPQHETAIPNPTTR